MKKLPQGWCWMFLGLLLWSRCLNLTVKATSPFWQLWSWVGILMDIERWDIPCATVLSWEILGIMLWSRHQTIQSNTITILWQAQDQATVCHRTYSSLTAKSVVCACVLSVYVQQAKLAKRTEQLSTFFTHPAVELVPFQGGMLGTASSSPDLVLWLPFRWQPER